jgi:hypothetical protein
MKIKTLVLFLFALICRSVADQSGIDVQKFGARPDGKTDNTLAFQRALDKASVKGGRVWVPEGQYRFNGTISIPEGVTLEGSWCAPHTSQLTKGTTLLCYAGRDQEDGAPFISLQTGSCLKGVTIFYPEQKVNDIHPYPWTIQGRGQHYNVLDVTISNAFNGIDCGTFHNEGHHLRNILMCALHIGVFIDQTTDIGRLENVHIHNVYWWRVSEPYRLTAEESKLLEDYTKQNLLGFIIGRTDWEYISNCFVIWAKIGFHFIKTTSPTGGVANALITQSGSDLGPLAVKIEAVQSHAGVIFENCQFMSGFEIGADNKGPVKLNNCGFWGRPGSGSQIDMLSPCTLTLTATHFHKWDYDNLGRACINVRNGSLLLTQCDFMKDGNPSPHVFLGDSALSAVITNSRFQHGQIKIINQSQAEVHFDNNVIR